MASPLAIGRKSLANLGEPVNIALAMPVLALIVVFVGGRVSATTYGIISTVVLCIVAAVTFFFTPILPE